MNNQTKLLLAFSTGLIISDIVPTPADAMYFYLERKNKEKLEGGKITPAQYWTRDALAYYGLNPIWWATVLGVSFAVGKNYTQKRNILLGMVAGGVVLGVLHKNVKAEEKARLIKQKELE